jgi:hypothetical protein
VLDESTADVAEPPPVGADVIGFVHDAGAEPGDVLPALAGLLLDLAGRDGVPRQERKAG